MKKIDVANLVTKEDLENKVDKATKRMDFLLTGVIVVMFLGFITLLISVLSPMIDAWRFKGSTYQNLVDKVIEQNNKIDDLNRTVNLICKTWRKDCPI